MSSGLRSDPSSTRAMLDNVVDTNLNESMSRVGRMGLTQRQMLLNRLWAYVRCQEYDIRRTDWNGGQVVDPLEREMIAGGQYIPPGFYDAAGQTLPLKYRRPTAPLGLVRTIVTRFSGLLFSSKRQPRIVVSGDPDTEDYLHALAESGRLMSVMLRARFFGGGMGSTAIGFKFMQGNIVFEAHDPRWCIPHFENAERTELEAFEKRYQYPLPQTNEDGEIEDVWYWHRRLITKTTDEMWDKVPVGEGDEPRWAAIRHETAYHNFGFVPIEWIQNLPVDDDIDGDPDCQGCYELVETIDALIAQANRGIIANCDPTLFLTTDTDLPEVGKGSGTAIQLEKGASGQYLEISGNGPRAAKELAEFLEERVYRLAQCVPESVLVQPSADRTATEIERRYSAMIEKADTLREQYGERGLRRLLIKVDAAVRKILTPYRGPDGRLVQWTINLPPKNIRDPASGRVVQQARRLGPGGIITLRWGRYFEPTLTDCETASRTADSAKMAGFIDREQAIKFVAPFLGIENPLELLARMEAAETAAAAEEEASAEMAEPEEPEEPPFDPTSLKPISLEALEKGAVTINEYRMSLFPPLGALPDGDLTLPQYKAKYPELFVAATAVTSNEAAKAFLAAANEPAAPAAPGAPPPTQLPLKGV